MEGTDQQLASCLGPTHSLNAAHGMSRRELSGRRRAREVCQRMMIARLAAPVFVVFEALACAWIANGHLPGLLLTPLPMPAWQSIALWISATVAVIPISALALGSESRAALTRWYPAGGVFMGAALWVILLCVHPLEAPPPSVARWLITIALFAPILVAPVVLLRRSATLSSGQTGARRRWLFSAWMVLGTYALLELTAGELLRPKHWRIMIQEGPYLGQTADPRGFFLMPHARWTHRYSSDPMNDFDADRSVSYATNSQGLRERELPLNKPAGTVRVAALGDSFTLGEGVSVEDAWPRQLERALRDRMERMKVMKTTEPMESCNVEVINAGASAYNTRQELEHFRRVVVNYQPDMVVLALVWNDTAPGEVKTFGRSILVGFDSLAQYLPLTSRLVSGMKQALGWSAASADPRDWADSFDALTDLRNDVSGGDGELWVAIFPDVARLADESLQAVYEMQESFCVKNGIQVVNAWPAFAKQPRQRWTVHPADAHPNAAAHRFFGEMLAERLSTAAHAICVENQ